MGKIMLEVKNLNTKYITRQREDIYAVNDVSLKISGPSI
jgi:peptide/nickel transport system ATP-binding protein